MITDRTLYAYEQFCENYYDDFSVASRTRRLDGPLAIVPNYDNSNDRDESLLEASKIGSKSEKHASAGFPTYHGKAMTVYEVPSRVKNKIRIKRDPYYKQKVINTKEARRQYLSPDAIAERKATRARGAKKRIENIAKKIGDWNKYDDEYV